MRLASVNKHFKLELRVPGLGPCHIWQMWIDRDGYGNVRIKEADNKPKRVHHAAWFIKYGYWPKYICHKCDQRPCGNADHLYEGDATSNSLDKRDAGSNPNQKLTFELANQIRQEYKYGHSITYRRLAKKYGVAIPTIQLIIENKNWVKRPPPHKF